MCKMLIRGLFMSAALAAVSAPAAHAAYTVTFEQDGANVVATGGGTIDLTGLTRAAINSVTQIFVDGALGLEFTGATEGTDIVSGYYGATGPATFGTLVGGSNLADSGEGDVVGVTTSGSSSFVVIYVDPSYVSGAELTTSATYDNQTLDSLGLTEGVYKYTWGTGAHADSFTVQIGEPLGSAPAPVPEASTWVMMLMGFGGLGAGALMRNRRGRISAA